MTITVEIESIQKTLIAEELTGLLPSKPGEFPEPLTLSGYSLVTTLGNISFPTPKSKQRRLLPSKYSRLVATIKYLSGDPAGNQKRRRRYYGVLSSDKYWHWDPDQRRHWDKSRREAVQQQISKGQKIWLDFARRKGPEWRELRIAINWDKACLPTLDHGRAPCIWPPKKLHKDSETRFGLVNHVEGKIPGSDDDDPTELDFRNGVLATEDVGRTEFDDAGSDRVERDHADPEVD